MALLLMAAAGGAFLAAALGLLLVLLPVALLAPARPALAAFLLLGAFT